MSSLRRQNTLYGFDTTLPSDDLNKISTISNGLCALNTSNSGAIESTLNKVQGDTVNVQVSPVTQPSDIAVPARQRGFSLKRTFQSRKKQTVKGKCAHCGAYSHHQKKDIKLRKLLTLILAFIIYVSLGAVAFRTLEGGPELERKEAFENYVDEFLTKHPCVNKSEVFLLLTKSVVDSELVFYVVRNTSHLDRWDFSGAFGFVVSVVTTIGFGNLSPFTMEGKIVCVFYAILGIPLTLLVLSAIGQKMAHYFFKIRRLRCAPCHQSPIVNKRLNVIIIFVIGIIIIFLLPAGIFSHVEDWHYLEAIYFCFTTLSTVGFGDYVIGLHEQRLKSAWAHGVYIVVAYIWILVGLSYLSLVYRIIMDTVVASARTVGQRTKQKLGTEAIDSSDSTPNVTRNESENIPGGFERFCGSQGGFTCEFLGAEENNDGYKDTNRSNSLTTDKDGRDVKTDTDETKWVVDKLQMTKVDINLDNNKMEGRVDADAPPQS